MNDWRRCIISKNASILDAVRSIDESGMQIALVLDNNMLVGILTDGDIRRAVLSNVDFSDGIEGIMKTNPIVARIDQNTEEIRALMKKHQVHQIPILDEMGAVKNVVSFVDIIEKKKYDNPIVIMAGGLGTRLLPLTESYPKPLLKVGSKPILEIILDGFIEKGFYNFYFSVNYKSEMIEDYFGDGSKWGISIRYIHENHKLGTAGALGLLKDLPQIPMIVMNGDILTKVDYEALLSYHLSESASATMAIREFCTTIPYGVLRMNNNIIERIDEKPMDRYLVNAGIYVLNPEVVDQIDENKFLDMPQLFEELIEKKKKVIAFPIREYWLDIGQIDDFKKAQLDYDSVWGDN